LSHGRLPAVVTHPVQLWTAERRARDLDRWKLRSKSRSVQYRVHKGARTDSCSESSKYSTEIHINSSETVLIISFRL
jgi:uncharacterized membrane protein